MKRKAFQNSLVVAMMAVTFCLSAAVLVTSCQKRDYPTASQQRKINKKLPYLEFKSGYEGPRTLRSEDWKVIMEAQKRMKITKTDGVWQTNIKSPKDANISPKVFELFRRTIENTNSFNQQRRKERSTLPNDSNQIIIR